MLTYVKTTAGGNGMKIISDIKVNVKVEVRFFTGPQTEMSSDIYYPVNSFEELEERLADYKKNNAENMVEDKDYDFIFYTKLYFFEEDQEKKQQDDQRRARPYSKEKKLSPLNKKEIEKLFHYIEEILYVNKSKEIQHNFNYNEIEIFIQNL